MPRAGRDAAIAQRAAVAAGLGEARAARAGGLGADRRDLAGRAGHRAGVEIDVKVALGQPALGLAGASGTGASTSTSRSASSARTGPVP